MVTSDKRITYSQRGCHGVRLKIKQRDRTLLRTKCFLSPYELIKNKNKYFNKFSRQLSKFKSAGEEASKVFI